MKTMIEKIFSARIFALLVAVCATSGAWAVAKPVAVWNRDFPLTGGTDTRGNLTLDLNGNTSDGVITIGSGATGGVRINKSTADLAFVAAVVGIKTNAVDFSKNPAIMTARSSGNANANNTVGLKIQSDGKFVPFHSTSSSYNNNGPQTSYTWPSGTGCGYFSFLYNAVSDYGARGTYAYTTTKNSYNYVYGAGGLVNQSTAVLYGLNVGGLYTASANSNIPNLSTAQIEYIAIFDSDNASSVTTVDDFKYWSLSDMTSAETISSAGGNITSGDRPSCGVNLNGGTVNVTANTTIAALFVQKDTELVFADGATLNISGPIYVADGKTLRITSVATISGSQIFITAGNVFATSGAIVSSDASYSAAVTSTTVGLTAYSNEASVSGAVDWSSITWADGTWHDGSPTTLTLTDDATINFDNTCSIPSLTLTGAHTATFVYTKTPAISGWICENSATYKIKIPAASTDWPLDSAWTVPNDGVTYILAGNADSSSTNTCSGKITVNGKLETTGYLYLSAENKIANTGELKVLDGMTKMNAGENGNGICGTLTIESGAVFENARSGDGLNYGGSPTVNVYGTLDMASTRWTLGGARLNFYAGSTITGNGQASYGALDTNDSSKPFNILAKAGQDTVNLSARLRPRAQQTFNIADGVTVNCTGTVSDKNEQINITGSGTFKIATGASFPSNVPFNIASSATLELAGGTVEGTITGSGRILYPAGEFPTLTGLNASGWTGTVEVPRLTTPVSIAFNSLGNTGSKVVLKGMDNVFANSIPVENGSTINPTLQIDGDFYLSLDNGTTTFKCVTGSAGFYLKRYYQDTSATCHIEVLTNFTANVGALHIDDQYVHLSIGTVALAEGVVPSIGTKLVGVDNSWDDLTAVSDTVVTIGGETTGYKLEKKSGGLYVAAVASVTPTGGVATEYATLSAAKTALGSNAGTITLLMPSAENISLAIGQVLDTNGNSYTGTVSPTGDYIEVASASGIYRAVDNSSNTWQGSSGGAWGTAANWEKGVVPNTYTAVTLPANGGTAYSIGVTSFDQCGSITVNGDVTLNRGTSDWQQLHINGNVSGSGTLTLNMVGLRADSGSSITVSCNFVGNGGTENAFVGGKPFTFENPVVIKGSSGSFFKNESVVITFNDSVEIQENAKLNANGANIVFCNSDIRLPSGGYLQPTYGAMTITDDAITWPSAINISGFAIDAASGIVGSLLVENTTINAAGDVQIGTGSTGSLTIGDGGVFKVGSSSGHKWLTFMTGSGNSEGNFITINEGGELEACVITFNDNSSPCPYAINFNGGKLKTYCGTDYYRELIHDTGIQVNVLAGGAKVEVPATYTATINPVMASGAVADGGLTKLGAGSLVVGSASYLPTYNGKTKVVSGALYLPSGYVANLDITTRETDSDKDGYKKYVVDPAATFNETSYDTVAAAIDAADTAGGGTVTLRRACDEDVTLVDGVYFNDGGFSYTGTINAPAAVAWNDGTVTYCASLDAANGAANVGAAQHKYVLILHDASFTPSANIKYLVADGVSVTLVPYSPEYGMPVVATTDGTTGAVTYNLFASNNPTTYTWTGSGSFNYWSLSGNWEYGEGSAARRRPQAGDSVVINTGATITIGNNESVSDITIGAAAPVTFTATSAKTLTVSGDIVLHNASASLVVNSNVTITDIGNKIGTDVADKCIIWANDGSSVTYSVADPVAQIGDVKYGSLANALENASDTATITILANMNSVGVGIGQKVVVASGVTVGTISWGEEYVVQTNVTGDGTTEFVATATATTFYSIVGESLAWTSAANWKVGAADGATATRAPTTGDTAYVVADSSVTIASANAIDGLTSLRGTGTLVLPTGSLPSSSGLTALLKNENWEGAVWIKNKTDITGTNFLPNEYGNTGSVVKLSGIKGWINATSTSSGGFTINPTIEVDNDIYEYGLWLSNGNGYNQMEAYRNHTILNGLKGSGTLKGSDAGGNALLLVKDWENFTGTLTLNNKIVVFGDELPEQAHVEGGGFVVVNSNKSVTVPAGKTWTLANGVIVYEGGNLSLGTGAAIANTTAANTWIKRGTGTVTLNALADLPATPANDWTGTVVLPTITSGGQNFNIYGNENSIVALPSMTGGWLNEGGKAVNTTLRLDGNMSPAALSNWTYSFFKITGNGSLTIPNSASPTSITITELANYNGTLINNHESVGVTVTRVTKSADVDGGALLLATNGVGVINVSAFEVAGIAVSHYAALGGFYRGAARYDGTVYKTFAEAIAAVEEDEASLSDITVLDSTAAVPDGYYIADGTVCKHQAAIINNVGGVVSYHVSAQAAVDASLINWQNYDHVEVYYGTDVEVRLGSTWQVVSAGYLKIKCLNGATVDVDATDAEFTVSASEPVDGLVSYTYTKRPMTYTWGGSDGTLTWVRPQNWRHSDSQVATRAVEAIDSAVLNNGAAIIVTASTSVKGIVVNGAVTLAKTTSDVTLVATTDGIVLADGATLAVTGVTLSPAPVSGVALKYVRATTSEGTTTYSLQAAGEMDGTTAKITDATAEVTVPAIATSIETVPVATIKLADGSAITESGVTVKYGDHDITTAFTKTVSPGVVSLSLNPSGFYQNGEGESNRIQVRPAVADSSPMTMGESSAGFTVKAIPGLYYAVKAYDNAACTGEATVGSAVQADGVSVSPLAPAFAGTVQYYKISVGISAAEARQ